MSERSPILISAIVLARNEEHRLERTLVALAGLADEIIVIDNESEDGTAELARKYARLVLSAPRATLFDGFRNLAIPHCRGKWAAIFDADEVPAEHLAPFLRRYLEEHGDDFEALSIPFRHYFCGRWMRNRLWWPGMKSPQILKIGHFTCGERLHSGVEVHGRSAVLPIPDPSYPVEHNTYIDISHYLTKLNGYTDGEAEALLADGKLPSWQAMLASFVQDWRMYYDAAGAHQDEMEGFLLSFLSGFYRLFSWVKLWNLRREHGELPAAEEVPTSVGEMLEFMLRMENPQPWYDRVLTPAEARHQPLPPPQMDPPKKRVRRPADHAGIAAVVIGKNEGSRIVACLRSLRGWVDKLILVDNSSTDDTVKLARPYVDLVLTAPPAPTLEAVRCAIAEELHAAAFQDCELLGHFDADENVPAELGRRVRRLVQSSGGEFDALCLPFRNVFYGKAMEGGAWWPGFKGPVLVRKGTFQYSPLIHTGILSRGRVRYFPSGDPELAILHQAYDTPAAYLEKLNRYTDAEGVKLRAAGESHSWQSHLAAFVDDWRIHYDDLGARADRMHGFVQSFLCAFYRFVSRAKLWDLRRQKGEPPPGLVAVPGSVAEMLSFMLHVYREGARAGVSAGLHPAELSATAGSAAGGARPGVGSSEPPPPAQDKPDLHPELRSDRPDSPAESSPRKPRVVLRGPVFGTSGFDHDGRELALSLLGSGEELGLLPDPKSAVTALPQTDRALLDAGVGRGQEGAEISVLLALARMVQRRPSAQLSGAGFQIGRTTFETDRLDPADVARLSRMDRLWVPSEFNRETFSRSGVPLEKIAVIPECIDPAPFLAELDPWPLPRNDMRKGGLVDARILEGGSPEPPLRILAVFDWSIHKGWDVLLECFALEFPAAGHAVSGGRKAELYIKTWSSSGLTIEQIRAQADAHLRATLGKGLDAFPNIHIWQELIPGPELPRLYRAVDVFLAVSRAEGWCRPLMEAMLAGLVTVATGWGGQTAYHDSSVGYPLKFKIVPVPVAAAREIPIFAGHCWAEPDRKHLRQLLRLLASRPASAAKRAHAARERIRTCYSREALAPLLQAELEFCRGLLQAGKYEHELASERKVETSNAPERETPRAAGPPAVGRDPNWASRAAGRLQPTAGTSSGARTPAILIQSASGEHTRLLDLARGYHEGYARDHGFEYVCRYEKLAPDRAPSWDRIALVLAALRQGKHRDIVWLDADTLIVDREADLRRALREGAWLGMVQDGTSPRPNAGALYVRACRESLAFFEEVWREWPIETGWEESEAVLRVLQRNRERWRGAVALDPAWNSTRLLNECPKPVVAA